MSSIFIDDVCSLEHKQEREETLSDDTTNGCVADKLLCKRKKKFSWLVNTSEINIFFDSARLVIVG